MKNSIKFTIDSQKTASAIEALTGKNLSKEQKAAMPAIDFQYSTEFAPEEFGAYIEAQKEMISLFMNKLPNLLNQCRSISQSERATWHNHEKEMEALRHQNNMEEIKTRHENEMAENEQRHKNEMEELEARKNSYGC